MIANGATTLALGQSQTWSLNANETKVYVFTMSPGITYDSFVQVTSGAGLGFTLQQRYGPRNLRMWTLHPDTANSAAVLRWWKPMPNAWPLRLDRQRLLPCERLSLRKCEIGINFMPDYKKVLIFYLDMNSNEKIRVPIIQPLNWERLARLSRAILYLSLAN